MSITYQVRIRGRLSPALLTEFEQLGLVADSTKVETQIYGLVWRVEALGLDLVELRRCPPNHEECDDKGQRRHPQ
jgi:hypothetical protein